MESARRARLGEEEYLERERAAESKSELVNGELVAMAGASPLHNAVASNIIVALGSRLRGRPCRPLNSDQRVHIPTTGLYCYPDVTVLCGQAEFHPKDPSTIINPTLLVEVLSESTRAYDRGEKAAHYRHLPSLAEFLLVEPEAGVVEHYLRLEPGRWVLSEHRAGDTLSLPSLSIEVPVAEMFERTELLRP